ncbi:MAG: hypothetical protein CR988_02610 [Treponema sp.]|nr:MAG: hypothetical protein CR988_02610 [Treponema sp.]
MKRFVLLLVFAVACFGHAVSDGFLDAGLDSYSREDWSSAILSFQKALDASGGRNENAQYWLIMAKTSARSYPEALKEVKRFIALYPGSKKMPDVIYQKGRVECMLTLHDESIETLYGFISSYPDNNLIPSAYFWIGENLYLTGRLDDARTVFSIVLIDYSSSAKGEAARYRIALIDQAATQEELLRLLKLSHEESLRLAEEYQKQQKTYEHVIEAYQKQLANSGQDEKIVELNQKILDERRKNAELYDKLTLLQIKNDELSAMLTALNVELNEIADAENASGNSNNSDTSSSIEDNEGDASSKKTRREILEELLRKANNLKALYESLLEQEKLKEGKE